MGVCQRGRGKGESGGLGETTRGKGDCSRAAPLPPGCLPKHPINPYCVGVSVQQIEYHQAESRISNKTIDEPVPFVL